MSSNVLIIKRNSRNCSYFFFKIEKIIVNHVKNDMKKNNCFNQYTILRSDRVSKICAKLIFFEII